VPPANHFVAGINEMLSLRSLKYSLHFTLHFTSLHFTSLHFTSLHFTSLHFTSLHFTSLLTSLHFTSLHFTSLHFTSLHFTSLHFTSLHFTSLQRILLGFYSSAKEEYMYNKHLATTRALSPLGHPGCPCFHGRAIIFSKAMRLLLPPRWIYTGHSYE
jgi:hypothetical protein